MASQRRKSKAAVAANPKAGAAPMASAVREAAPAAQVRSADPSRVPAWAAQCLSVALFCAVVWWLIQPLFGAGWGIPLERPDHLWYAEIYRAHFLAGDYWPVWSSLDSLGYGSAAPGVYHRVFLTLVTSLNLWGLSWQSSFTAVIAAALLLGALGCMQLGLRLRLPVAAAAIAGLLWLVAAYTTHNWQARVAYAEFLAMSAVPWLLLAACTTLDHGKAPWWTGPLVGIMALCHTAVAFWAVLLVSVAVLVAGRAHWRKLRFWMSGLAAALVALVMVLPHLLAIQALQEATSLQIMRDVFNPRRSAQDFLAYFWTRGTPDEGIARFDVHWLMMGAFLLTWRLLFQPKQPIHPFVWVLCGIGGVCLALQLPGAYFVFELIPGGTFIQFPYRLLAISTPCLAVGLLALLWAEVQNVRARWALAISALAISVVLVPRYRLADQNNFNMAQLQNFDASKLWLNTYGEYLPPTARMARSLPPAEVYSSPANCRLRSLDAQPAERMTRRFEFDCGDAVPAELRLPAFASSFHRVSVLAKGSEAKTLRCAPPDAQSAGVCRVALGGQQRGEIQLHTPTWFDLVQSKSSRP